MTASFFREYDLRGDAERDFPDPVVARIGAGLAALLSPGDRPPRLVVCHDARRSSPRLRAALQAGLIAGGATVLDVGFGPSPLGYFALHHLAADGGIVITGSHNPKSDNGFKILRGAAPLFGEELRTLAPLLDLPPPPSTRPGTVTPVDVTDAYLGALTRGLRLGPRLPRLVVDGGSGAAGPLGLRALRAVGLEPEALHCEPDGDFPHREPDPRPEQLAALQARVLAFGADAGIAWDGDGDRLGVLDRDGEYVWNDRLLALFARQVLVEHPGGVVLGEVKCSRHLFDDIARHGGRPVLCRTGHSHLKVRMKTEGALVGGETSGHFFFGDRYLGFDDAIYASLRLVEILSQDARSIEARLTDLPRGLVTPEIRIPARDEDKQRLVAAVREELAGQGELLTVDGVRVHFADGAWALVRASNTGPALSLRFEAPTAARLAELRARVEAALERARLRLEPEGKLDP